LTSKSASTYKPPSTPPLTRDGAKRFFRIAGLLARPRSGSQLRLLWDASSLKCEIDADGRKIRSTGLNREVGDLI
jgi:hypothetical protein